MIFIKKHRTALALLAAGLLALCAFWAARGNAAAMAWWVERVSMPCKRLLSALVDPLLLSACELGATLLILLALAGLARCLWRAVHHRPTGVGAWALHVAVQVVWIYALVCAFWGTQYYAPSFAARAGMHTPAVSVEQLAAVTRWFAAQVNAAADGAPRAADGTFAVPAAELLQDTAGLYDALLEEYPFLAAPERHAKPALYSKLMSAWGFTGYLCPLFGESTLNVDVMPVFIPATICHEFAHQRGVAAEQEANFVAVRAAVTSGRPVYEYSGWLFGYLYLSNALYGADRALHSEIYATLCPQAQADMAANNAYWARWEGPVRETGEQVYEAFLQAYDQPLGMKSYGACVDLLVEYYLPMIQ